MIRDTGPVAFANSKQGLLTIVISCHSWTSLQNILWLYDRSRFTFPSVFLIKDLACSNRVGRFIPGLHGGNFRKLPSGRIDSSNLFATPGKQRPSSPLCVSLWSNEFPQRAYSRSKKLAVCLAIAWIARQVEPSLLSATPSAAWTLRRHFISSLARWRRLTRREASCVRDGTLKNRFEKRKQSNESRISDDRKRRWTDLLHLRLGG